MGIGPWDPQKSEAASRTLSHGSRGELPYRLEGT